MVMIFDAKSWAFFNTRKFSLLDAVPKRLLSSDTRAPPAKGSRTHNKKFMTLGEHLLKSAGVRIHTTTNFMSAVKVPGIASVLAWNSTVLLEMKRFCLFVLYSGTERLLLILRLKYSTRASLN